MANLPLALAELVAGGVILTAGISDPNGSISNVIKGLDTGHGVAGFDTGSSPGGSSSSTPAAGSAGPVSSGYTNPFPGATASRVDQGVDYTSSKFLAPGASKIVVADPSNAGWGGGGYIAGQLLSGPYAGKVWYMAEGLTPTVAVGDVVNAGQSVASAIHSPYNGILGNIEAGWANPGSPGSPLAQITGGYTEGDSTGAGASFNRWVQALGGPLGHLAGSVLGNIGGLGLP